MHLVHSLAVLLFLSYHVLAAPAPQSQQKGRSFKVDRLGREDYVADGPTALRNAYRKYHIVPTDTGVEMDDFEPVDTKSAVASNNNGPDSEPERNGSVSARSVQSDVAFVSPVTIGGQKIVMNFDTGSSDFWVMSSTTPAAAKHGHNVFNLSNSPTFEVMKGHSFEITYGDGSHAAGLVGTDKVDIGGITFPNQAIGIPVELSQSFIEGEISNGLVGLGFQSLSTIQPEKQPTFFGNVAPTLDEPVLTALLKSDGVGEYEFGVIDHSKYQGQLVNVSVDASNGWWQFPSKIFSVGDGPYQAIGKSPSAIADTGTSLLMASPEVVEGYYAQVPGSKHVKRAGGYIFPCNAELPSLSIFAGHVRTIIPGRMMNFSYVGINRRSGEELCFGGLQSNQGMPMQIFGDVFLKALFVVFDRRGPSLGLAVPSRY